MENEVCRPPLSDSPALTRPTEELILHLYRKYRDDLRIARKTQKRFYTRKGHGKVEKYLLKRAERGKYRIYSALDIARRRLGLYDTGRPRMVPQFDDIEAEITYLLIREFEPANIVEISPCGGWSTSWILRAIRDNGLGRLYSFDLVDHSTKILPRELSESRWVFIHGDVREKLHYLPPTIDYLFLDSDHSAEFARWHIRELFPRLNDGVPVSVHDVFHTAEPSGCEGEDAVVVEWLERMGIQYFTASPAVNRAGNGRIVATKKELGLGGMIHYSESNPAIFFSYRRVPKTSPAVSS